MSRAAASQLRAFLGAFSPEIGRIALRVRSFVLAQGPAANEFVGDADNPAAMGYGFTDHAGDAFCHVVLYSGWVNLGFDHGSEIPDPEGLLEGTGPQIRHIRIASLDDLYRPFVGRLLRAAMKAARRPGDAAGKRSEPRSAVRAVHPAGKGEGA